MSQTFPPDVWITIKQYYFNYDVLDVWFKQCVLKQYWQVHLYDAWPFIKDDLIWLKASVYETQRIMPLHNYEKFSSMMYHMTHTNMRFFDSGSIGKLDKTHICSLYHLMRTGIISIGNETFDQRYSILTDIDFVSKLVMNIDQDTFTTIFEPEKPHGLFTPTCFYDILVDLNKVGNRLRVSSDCGRNYQNALSIRSIRDEDMVVVPRGSVLYRILTGSAVLMMNVSDNIITIGSDIFPVDIEKIEIVQRKFYHQVMIIYSRNEIHLK